MTRARAMGTMVMTLLVLFASTGWTRPASDSETSVAQNGAIVYYPNGRIAQDGAIVYYPDGALAKSGDMVYYADGRVAKRGRNVFDPGGRIVQRGEAVEGVYLTDKPTTTRRDLGNRGYIIVRGTWATFSSKLVIFLVGSDYALIVNTLTDQCEVQDHP